MESILKTIKADYCKLNYRRGKMKEIIGGIMKKIVVILCLFTKCAVYGKIEIDNRSSNTTFIDKITLLTYNGISHDHNIKEINLPVAAGQTIEQQQLVGMAKAPIVQIVIIHNNITYLFSVSPGNQHGSIVITRDNRVTSDGNITLTETRGLSPIKQTSSWGVRKL